MRMCRAIRRFAILSLTYLAACAPMNGAPSGPNPEGLLLPPGFSYTPAAIAALPADGWTYAGSQSKEAQPGQFMTMTAWRRKSERDLPAAQRSEILTFIIAPRAPVTLASVVNDAETKSMACPGSSRTDVISTETNVITDDRLAACVDQKLSETVVRYFVSEHRLFVVGYMTEGRALTDDERRQMVALISSFAVGTCSASLWC